MPLGDGSILTLEKVDRQHSGVYQCEAKNGVRQPAMAEIVLKVLSNFILLLSLTLFRPFSLELQINRLFQWNTFFLQLPESQSQSAHRTFSRHKRSEKSFAKVHPRSFSNDDTTLFYLRCRSWAADKVNKKFSLFSPSRAIPQRGSNSKEFISPM